MTLTKDKMTHYPVIHGPNRIADIWEGNDTGTTTDNYTLALDLDLKDFPGAKYLAIVLENTGPNALAYELRKTLPNTNSENIETSGTVDAGMHAFLELSRPLYWKLYVKNAAAGASTTYKVTARVVA